MLKREWRITWMMIWIGKFCEHDEECKESNNWDWLYKNPFFPTFLCSLLLGCDVHVVVVSCHELYPKVFYEKKEGMFVGCKCKWAFCSLELMVTNAMVKIITHWASHHFHWSLTHFHNFSHSVFSSNHFTVWLSWSFQYTIR